MTNTNFITRADQMPTGKYSNISDDTLVKQGEGQLLGFYVNSTSSGTIIIYDNTVGSGTKIANTITPGIGWHWLPVAFATGLFIDKTGGSIDLTAVYV